MKRIAGIVSISLLTLVTGCGTMADGSSARNSADGSASTAERMARLQGCDPTTGAQVLGNTAVGADYQIKCSNGTQLTAHCEGNQCTLGQQITAAPTTTGSVQVSSVRSNTVVAQSGAPADPRAASNAAVNQAPQFHQDPAELNPVRVVFATGLNYGGDTLATESFNNGKSTNLNAGKGVQFSIGADFRFDEHFSGQATVGYEVDNSSASNADLRFQRIPVEFLGYYHITNEFRVGGGVRFVENPRFIGTGVFAGTVDFKNTVGGVLEAEYVFGRHYGLKLRATKESYTAVANNQKFSGNSAGIFFNLYY